MNKAPLKPNTKRTSGMKKATSSQNPPVNGRLLRFILPVALILVVVASLGVALTTHNGSSATYSDFPSLGQTHIPDGASHPPYNSNPPTSGWHYASPADWGIYHATLADETLVHNLEHGGIWLSYRDANDAQLIQLLDAIVNQFPDHVILTYRPTDDQPIAVAAWGHLLTLNTIDNTVILDFIKRYINKGPENV